MSIYNYLLIALIIVIVGAIATILVAVSKENKEGNPDYDAKKKKNWTRLTLYYVIAAGISIALFVVFMLTR